MSLTSAEENREEARERSHAVAALLARCSEELLRIEAIPGMDAEELNMVSMAKGYVQRAESALKRIE